jgi:hypothetical protein
LRSTVATAIDSFLASEKESIAASVSEVSIPESKFEYFLAFNSSMAAFANPPIFEDLVRPRLWSSRCTTSRVAILIGPLMRSRSSSSMSLLCSSISKRKLESRRTVRGRLVFTELFRTLLAFSNADRMVPVSLAWPRCQGWDRAACVRVGDKLG